MVARWHHAVTQIVFDPDNAFQVGTGLRNAACDATGTTPEMMGSVKTELTNEARAKILKSPGRFCARCWSRERRRSRSRCMWWTTC